MSSAAVVTGPLRVNKSMLFVNSEDSKIVFLVSKSESIDFIFTKKSQHLIGQHKRKNIVIWHHTLKITH